MFCVVHCWLPGTPCIWNSAWDTGMLQQQLRDTQVNEYQTVLRQGGDLSADAAQRSKGGQCNGQI